MSSDEINRYGLRRYIDAETRRAIRRSAGFGCVSCGLAIGQYEHIDPTFADAKEHDPERMTFVCGACHDKVNRKIWSKEKLSQDRLRPWALKQGRRCHDAFDVGGQDVAVWFCSTKCVRVRHILRINGETLLAIEPPEEAGGPYRLSGRFYDSAGKLRFEIARNEWTGDPLSYDIETVGPRLIIRSEPREICLQLCAHPPRGIVIERLKMQFGTTRIQGNRKELHITGDRNVKFSGPFSITGHEDGVVFLDIGPTWQSIAGGGYAIVGPDNERPPWHKPATNDSPCPCAIRTTATACRGL